MKRKLCGDGLRLLSGASLMMIAGCTSLQAQESQGARADAIGKPPYNVVFLIVDQQAYRLLAGPEYTLPGIDAIARSSAFLGPSRFRQEVR
jgi:hypothetical protein